MLCRIVEDERAAGDEGVVRIRFGFVDRGTVHTPVIHRH